MDDLGTCITRSFEGWDVHNSDLGGFGDVHNSDLGRPRKYGEFTPENFILKGIVHNSDLGGFGDVHNSDLGGFGDVHNSDLGRPRK